MSTATLLHEFKDHAGPIYALCPGPRGLMLSGGADRIVASWNAESKRQGDITINVGKGIYSLCLLPNQQLLIGDADGNLRSIDLINRQEARLIEFHKKGIFEILSLPEKGLALTAGGEGVLGIWNEHTLELIRQIPLTDSKLRCISISSDNQFLAVGTTEGKIHVLDTEWFNEVSTIQTEDSVNSLAWHPSKSLLCSGGKDAFLRFWHTEEWNEVRAIPAHNFAVYAISYSPDGEICATASFDKTIKLWDASSFNLIQRIDSSKGGHRSSVNRLVWENANCLWSVSDDKHIKIWNIER